eukprot:s552_g24.t1
MDAVDRYWGRIDVESLLPHPTMSSIVERTAGELRGSITHLHKDSAQKLQDIESKAATIQHLQSALKAKNQTIEILSKSRNTNGENLGAYIEEAVAEQCKNKLAEKDEEVNRLMELLHDMEERQMRQSQGGTVTTGTTGAIRSDSDLKEIETLKERLKELEQSEQQRQVEHLELQQLRRDLEELQRHSREVEALAAERAADNDRLETDLREMREEADANAAKLGQFREYQSKAFELKHTNDVLSEQLEALQDEMQRMQSDYGDEVEQLKKEISISQNDRRTHRQAVEEHVEAKISHLRKEKNAELLEALQQTEEKTKKIKEINKDLETERDRLRLKIQAQELELQALHEGTSSDNASGERVIALREQSQFAFDEMAKRLVEIREEGETERKRLQADLEQQLKQRAATLVEVQNDRDRAETHAEALEQSNKDLSQQRDELVRQLGEERKRTQELQEELDLQHEHQKTQQQHYAVLALVHALQKSTVMPAFSLVRRSIDASHGRNTSPNLGEQKEEIESFDAVEEMDSAVDTSVGEAGGSEEEDDSDDEPEDSYGTDNAGQEEWTELMKANTFEACFVGADTIGQNTSRAASDLQEHVSNITTSLEFFPQIYPSLLQELDKSPKGYGKELRKFILVMQKATDRAVRIASKVVELCEQNADVIAKSKNLFRLKSLDGHLKSLRTAGQHEVLLRFYKNQLAAQKEAYEDVLDQYGAQCEQNTELEEKLDSLGKERQELLNELASCKSNPKETGQREISKEVEQLRIQLEDAKKHILRLESKEQQANCDQSLEQAASPTDSGAASQSSKGKGKSKKGPGPPPSTGGVQAAEDPAAENAEAAQETPPAGDEASSSPAPAKAKGKGKKGPGPPPSKGGVQAAEDPATTENAATAQETPSGGDEVSSSPAPAKAKGKGKKGPGLPPSKGGVEQPQTDENTSPDTAPPAGPSSGKGGKAPPKGGSKGKSKGKSALPDIDPGPAPPKDMVGKKFHWTNVLGNRFAGSMFERIVEDLNSSAQPTEQANDQLERASKTLRVKLDVGVLTNFFFKRKEETETSTEVKESKKKTVAQCLSMQRSQNIEIFLNGCGINISHVKRSILDLDEKAIDADNLGKVIEILPQGEELQELMEFKKNNDPKVLPWGRAEEFLLQLLEIPNFKIRAECCLTKSRFDPVCNELLQDIELLHRCLSNVVDSSWLPNIFALVMQMGNYLNHGTNKGQQRGFTLDTLPLLTRVEGFHDKSYSLIRFLMDTLESDRKVKDGALKDLELCESSAKLDFDESVRRLNEIEKKVTLVEGSLKELKDDAKTDKADGFQMVMQAFVKAAQATLSKLKEKVEEVQVLSKRCCDLFAEKPRTPTAETLGKLAAFRKDMEDGRRQNLMAKVKKEKAEKRKAEQQAKAQARKSVQQVEQASEASTSKRTMQVKVPEKPSTIHMNGNMQRGAASTVNTTLLREALALATSTTSTTSAGRMSMGLFTSAAGERKTMGHPGRQTLDPSMSGPSDPSTLLADLAAFRRELAASQASHASQAAAASAAASAEARADAAAPDAPKVKRKHSVSSEFRDVLDAPSTGAGDLGAIEAGGASIQKDGGAAVASVAPATPSASAEHGAGAKDANAADAAHRYRAEKVETVETAEKLERHGVESVGGLEPKQLQLNSSPKELPETEVNEFQHSLRKAEDAPRIKLLEVDSEDTSMSSALAASRHTSVLEGQRMSVGDPRSRTNQELRVRDAGRLTVGHSGHPGVSARGVGSPSRGQAKAKAKAGTQRKCFGGDLLKITKSGRLSLGPRSAAALAAAEAADERESLANTLRQAKQERMSTGASPLAREVPLVEEMPVSMEPRESLANKVRQAKAKAKSGGASPKNVGSKTR